MIEPTPDRGEPWEQFYWRRVREAEELDVVLWNAEPWERAGLKQKLQAIEFDIQTAKRYLDDDF